MADQLSLSTIEIVGIGERAAGDLVKAGIHTVGDLLRVTVRQVHDAVRAHASPQEARAWCQMAAFLQINGMTPAWARALQGAGLAGVSDLQYRGLPDLREIFATADEGPASPAPTDAQLFEIVKDATVIANTGAVNGTVVGEGGLPIPEATVQLGKTRTATDARGRFRVMRIALWTRSTAFISHPEYRSGLFPLERVEPSVSVHARAFELHPRPRGVPAEPEVLMEVRGDRLPPVGDAPVSAREVGRADLLERDILTVVERSADGGRVKLVSKLLIWEDGRFRVPYCWFEVADVPTPEPGRCFVVRADGLEPITVTPARLARWVGMLRAMREAGPRPADPGQLDGWLSGLAAAMPTLRVEGRF